MCPARLPLPPHRRHLLRLARWLAAGALALPLGCQISMPVLARNGPPVPGPLSTGMTPPLALAAMRWESESDPPGDRAEDEPAEEKSVVVPVAHEEKEAAGTIALSGNGGGLEAVLRAACAGNARIQAAREHVHESLIALDAANRSCVPELLRKDTFKRPVADAQVWRRRAELSKVQNEVLQDAANTYIDWLTAQRGEAVARDLQKFEEKLLKRLRDTLASDVKEVEVLVEATETAVAGRRQFIARTHQQGEAAAAKLAYLLGAAHGLPPGEQELAPIDLVDPTVPVSLLVGQTEGNGPGVRELQGLAASIQNSLAEAHHAQKMCQRTGSPMVCGRLQIAQSQLQQAQLALVDLQGKLKAGVEEALSSILSGREQITLATDMIRHAAETYRIMNLRLESENPRESLRNNTYNSVLTSIQQLSQSHANYLTAVSAYDKAEARLQLLLGTFNDCAGQGPCASAPH